MSIITFYDFRLLFCLRRGSDTGEDTEATKSKLLLWSICYQFPSSQLASSSLMLWKLSWENYENAFDTTNDNQIVSERTRFGLYAPVPKYAGKLRGN